MHAYWELSDAPTCLGQPVAITPRSMEPTAGTCIASGSPVCVRKHMIRMLTRLQRRSVAHLPCRVVADLALTTGIAHLPLHPVVPQLVVRHLVALHPVVTVVGNESQTRDGLARETAIGEGTFISSKLRRHAYAACHATPPDGTETGLSVESKNINTSQLMNLWLKNTYPLQH